MLAKATIIRAWRDKAFRASLSEKELENLPLHPSGVIEIPDAILNTATGGTSDVTGDPAGASTCYNACGGGGGGGGGGSAIVKGGGVLHVGFCRNYVTSFISKASDALFHYPKTFVNINSHNQTAKEHNKMLSNTTIIRAWRDKTFRASLSQEQMQNMPEHPCGIIELSDDSLRNVAGGTTYFSCDSTPASTCFDSSCGGGGGGGGRSAYFAGGVCCM